MKCSSVVKTCRKCETKNVERLEMCGCGEGLKCDREAVNGYTLCSSHGGPSPARNFYGRGIMTTGSGSSFPLTRLAASYNKMMNDGKVLSNREAINVIDHRVRQLLGRIDMDEAPDRIANLHRIWQEFDDTETGTTDYIVLKKKLSDEFEKIYHDYAAWTQMFEALDLRGKMVEREVKVLKEIKAIMTAEDGYELAAKMMAAVMRVVGDDPKRMKQVQYEFAKIIGESSDNVTEGLIKDDGGSSAGE